MNKIQRKISHEAKSIERETKFSWSCCKWAAKKKLKIRE